MLKVKIEEKETIAIIRLNNGITNPVDIELVEELNAALKTVESNYKGLVFAGGDKFFSMGFNLPKLLTYDKNNFETFFNKFNNFVLNLYSMSIPTCAAVKGHAVAGGCILAIACDFIIAASNKKIGLNEIKLGVPVPYLADLILRKIVSDKVANNMLYTGNFLTTDEAATFGLISVIAEPEMVEEIAVNKIKEISNLPRNAFSAIKQSRVRSIIESYKQDEEKFKSIFINCWFDENTKLLLEEAAKKF